MSWSKVQDLAVKQLSEQFRVQVYVWYLSGISRRFLTMDVVLLRNGEYKQVKNGFLA
tara:strand:+ start:143 stop:313 length:171 start_codon:yes stop_codon:yes gene_type:complete